MDEQKKLVNYLCQVLGEEGCCVSCNTHRKAGFTISVGRLAEP